MSKNNIDVGWNFDNSYARLPKLFFTKQAPIPVESPELVILNSSLANLLGLNNEELQSENGVAIFAGNGVPKDAEPLAQAYAGHQFGHFTMLGDGRAILLGEQVTPNGDRLDIQLKGSGRTPYSRGGDGRAALGPMLREYIISEAMYNLGIPTTRSLAVVTIGEAIMRETILPGAVLTRVAASHLRVGTFQYTANWGTEKDIRILADYAIKRHYPDFKQEENKYLLLLTNVIKRQAQLIAKWMQVGFIHGVMNTDNMTISGETIDYGPCAFMDTYDPATVFSSIDRQGRYAYGNQPYIGAWNLARFAESLLPLLDKNEEKAVEIAQEHISGFTNIYQSYWQTGMRAKLGIFNEEDEDKILIKDLLEIMKKYHADYTNTFRAFSLNKHKETAMFGQPDFEQWFERWQSRLARQNESKESSQMLMQENNPAVIPRNHRVEEALKAAVEEGDFSVMGNLLQVLSNPYSYSKEQEKFSTPPAPSKIPYRTFCGT